MRVQIPSVTLVSKHKEKKVSNITKEQDDAYELVQKICSGVNVEETFSKYEEYLFNNYIKVEKRIKDECT